MQHEWDLIGANHIESAFCDWRHNVREIRRREAVEFLHDAVPAHVRGSAAGDEEQRGRIAVRGCKSDNRVRRTRADRGASSDRLARDAIVCVRNVNGALFVHYLDEAQLGNRIVEGINHAPISVSRQAGDIGNAVRFESLSDDLSHCELHRHLRAQNPAAPHILLPAKAGSE